MADIEIQHINASKVRLNTMDEGILEDLYRTLRFKEPTFAPNKFSKWDGEVRLFDKSTRLLNYGLIYHLLDLSRIRQWSLSLDDEIKQDLKPVTKGQIEEWCDSIDLRDGGNRISPYDYQREGLYLAIRYSRITLLAATSAGKSLLQYMIIRMMQEINPEGKILLVVPSINLVSQMKSDFANYSSHNGWDAEKNCHCVAEGTSPFSNKPVIISTYQSLMNLDESYFHQYTTLLGDECHLYSAKSLEKIANSCINAYNRVGLTGTLKQDRLHPLQVSQHFGVIKRIVTTKQLQDAGRAAKTSIVMALLKYQTEERKQLFDAGGDYQKEIEYLTQHKERNRIIANLASGLKGNSLLLFERVDSHLIQVFEELKQRQGVQKKFLVIHGEIGNKERDIIKAETEAGNDITILATYGCMSTGVSIKKLHNLVFCHPSKSIIRILQSIGRLLRLHSSKDVANIFDLVDDLSYMGKKNHALNHSIERYGFYTEEQHPIRSLTINIGEKLTTKTVSVI